MNHRKAITGLMAALFLTGTVASAQSAPKADATPKGEPKIRKTVIYKDGQLIETDGPALFETFSGKGFLGVHVVDLTGDLRAHFGVPAESGVMVSKVEPDSPAGRAGLQVGDIITAIDGTKMSSAISITRAVRGKKDGDRVTLEVSRNRAPLRLTATLEEREMPLLQGFRFQLPEGKLLEGHPANEAVERLQTYFKSPEWLAKVDQLGDCSQVQNRIKDLESRLKDLEKRLEKK